MGYLDRIHKFGKKVVGGVAKFGEKHKGKIALLGAVATFAHSRWDESDEPPIPDHLKEQARQEMHKSMSNPARSGLPKKKREVSKTPPPPPKPGPSKGYSKKVGKPPPPKPPPVPQYLDDDRKRRNKKKRDDAKRAKAKSAYKKSQEDAKFKQAEAAAKMAQQMNPPKPKKEKKVRNVPTPGKVKGMVQVGLATRALAKGAKK